ncbi:hypothetical protein ASPZODRAFT_149038 [Penicilliopsis zonata CBS 506.65]|uniref:U3 small nucleolar ribonucleoprotein protein MPP10 n=1 Tax=Penicilliopsis zonata CBS 506.65 TaxID=1073090 RepID=A0A1L9SQS6_9EURO|nr:hypothetical protein ASPZODRAFT_149038 [Penicilliopsis zonata CBS 506.65]OJJ49508.1 hypothetical protein ASPZODRAFT_149038 [Penicilliopsis zonata CBS 506.65]
MATLPSVPGSSQAHNALDSILSAPWTFLHPTNNVYTDTVHSAKSLFDSLAKSVSETQYARQKFNRKRKRSEVDEDTTNQLLRLKQLYVDGFTSDQIWEQAMLILESVGLEVKRDISLRVPCDTKSSDEETGISDFDDDEERNDTFDQQESELYDEQLQETASETLDMDILGSEQEDPSDDVYMQDPFGLNDGFFSIDDFNKQTEFLEQLDAKGEPEDESDDDDIDWHADPHALGGASSIPAKSSRPKNQNDAEVNDSDESSEDDGPTFGDMELESGLEDENESSFGDEENPGFLNTNDIKYADFFAPPPRKVTSKKFRALPKTQPAIQEDDIERAMADVHRDLFADGMSVEDEDPFATPDGDKDLRSTHERQRARIADEIRRLEAANIAKKDWMLAGEARAPERPTNSLIEEDLEFERIGKPVPVVTNELTEGIEELVKRRIIAKEFDEVIRRRPGVSDGQATKRGRFELEDTKPQQSLAELYETEHLRTADPNFLDKKDQKLMREHSEISNLWKEISSQLDTLSNWHYKPNVPQATISSIADVATITMEDARPTVSHSINEQATLAPQEIYTPGDDGKINGEVSRKNGASIAKEEMSREEKSRMRRQEKERQKKAGFEAGSKNSNKISEKQQVISNLKKGGVKLISKQGEVTDIHGSRVGNGHQKAGADTLKL